MSYDLLFEPVRIGPVTAPNRFFQVPHCNSLGHAHPRAEAANRAIKAEGGWGVICTQEVEIHPSADISPAVEGRLWDQRDIPAHQLMTDSVHKHGALAGIELCYNGHHAPNLYSRVAPMSVSAMPVDSNYPQQARAMSLADIKSLRQWHVDAAKRAMEAGYDIIYAYAGHDMSSLMHFMLQRYNRRTDQYGGSLENRVRLTREILESIKDAVGHRCAVAFRFAVDEKIGAEGMRPEAEATDIVSMLAELPDLWDVNVSDWSNDSATARFEPQEGYQEDSIRFVKQLTTRPVVGVGRFTSADKMVSQVKRGVLDLIGAARPSIADPFLPSKIKNGELELIRECIGCNICVACDNIVSPIRCTQNPTMGEEWKRGWHPEKAKAGRKKGEALVVGGGPAGLECALQLSKRGYPVMLAEAGSDWGGRLLNESKLPGLASYIRVRDYRLYQLERSANVQLLAENALTAEDILDTGIQHLFIATGSTWRRDGMGRAHPEGVSMIENGARVLTPDDIYAGVAVTGHVVVYDDDHYYLGGVLAEQLQQRGCEVTLVTPSPMVSAWTEHTLEQSKIQTRLIKLGINIVTTHSLRKIAHDHCELSCIYSEAHQSIHCDAVLMVTSRQSEDQLYRDLSPAICSANDVSHDGLTDGPDDGPNDRKRPDVFCIGDCEAPSTVAAAVYSGHHCASEFDRIGTVDEGLYRREMISLES